MSFLSCQDWTPQQIEQLFIKSDDYQQTVLLECHNKTLINAFFEPSTRTCLSFECAMKRLGGRVINFHKDNSSLKKEESFEDTVKTLSQYGELMVIRHPIRGLISKCQSLIDIPIINAGDGSGEHPTQALIDLYTIYKHFGDVFKEKSILLVGDHLNSRTIHSLLILLNKYPKMKIYILAYPGLGPSKETLNEISLIHHQPLEDIIVTPSSINYQLFDVIYMTRLQRERLDSDKVKDKDINFMLTSDLVNKMKHEAIVMHPLPRNDEIDKSVDNNHRCHYFKQVKYSVFVRMAIISSLIN